MSGNAGGGATGGAAEGAAAGSAGRGRGAGLSALLAPQSVAIVGASDNPARIGGRPLGFMLKAGFPGRLYPVNPNRATVQGVPAWRSVRELPEAVDCAIVALPAAEVAAALEDCAAAGVRGAVIFSSGFAETGAAGAAAQARIAAILRESGMRALGPNCLGVFDSARRWFGTFADAPGWTRVPPAPVAIVSQSGAVGFHLFAAAQARGLGIRTMLTTGNECDVDLAEVIGHLADDPGIEVILAYAEGLGDGARLGRALEAARRAGKPVVFLKVGRSAAGERAVGAHTAALAGRDAVWDAALRRHGAWRAGSIGEMLDVAHACRFGLRPAGRRLGILTVSGGVGVQMADAAERHGLAVEPLPEAAQAALRRLVPHASVANPVDFTGQALNDPGLIEASVTATLAAGATDALVLYLSGVAGAPFTRAACMAGLARIRARHPETAIALVLFADAEVQRECEALGYPCYDDPDLAVRAIAAAASLAAARDRAPDPPPAPPPGMRPAAEGLGGEAAALAVLASAGIPALRPRLARSPAEAVAAWAAAGGPVAMKIASPDIAHKTEAGGVALGIDGAETVARTHAALLARVRAARPGARLEGVLVAPMVPEGLEMVLGASLDPVFGPVVMVGFGGILVELLQDVALGLAPLGPAEARAMIDGLRGRALLDGARGRPAVDVAALAEALARLSVFAAANADRIAAIDINPFVLRPEGGLAVDALIVPREA